MAGLQQHLQIAPQCLIRMVQMGSQLSQGDRDLRVGTKAEQHLLFE